MNKKLSSSATVVASVLALSACGGSSHSLLSDSGSGSGAGSHHSGGAGPGAGGWSASGGPAGITSSAAGASSSRASGSGGHRSSGAAGSSTGGSSGNRSEGNSAQPGHAPPAFIAQADAICRSYRQQVASIGKKSDLVSVEEQRPTLVHDARAAVARLQTLSPPAPYAPTYSRFTDMTARSIDEFDAAQTRSRSKNVQVDEAQQQQDMAIYGKAVDDASAAGAAARQLGMRVCGSSGSEWM